MRVLHVVHPEPAVPVDRGVLTPRARDADTTAEITLALVENTIASVHADHHCLVLGGSSGLETARRAGLKITACIPTPAGSTAMARRAFARWWRAHERYDIIQFYGRSSARVLTGWSIPPIDLRGALVTLYDEESAEIHALATRPRFAHAETITAVLADTTVLDLSRHHPTDRTRAPHADAPLRIGVLAGRQDRIHGVNFLFLGAVLTSSGVRTTLVLPRAVPDLDRALSLRENSPVIESGLRLTDGLVETIAESDILVHTLGTRIRAGTIEDDAMAGIVVRAALACGKPVLTANRDGLPQPLRESLHITSTHPSAFARRIAWLNADRTTLRALTESCVAHARPDPAGLDRVMRLFWHSARVATIEPGLAAAGDTHNQRATP